MLSEWKKTRSFQVILTVYLIAQWMFFSCAIILYNKYILHQLEFGYPCTLVLMHMLFVTLSCQLWKRMGWTEVPSISWVDIRLRFVPVAFFFAASLGLSNAAYLFITVAFIQMIKAATPVFVLTASFMLRLEKPSWALCGWIVMIVTGVTTASANEVEFVLVGVIIQVVAMVCEAMRLALINKVLVSRGLKLAPIAFLYYMAPLCAAFIIVPWAIVEAPKVFATDQMVLLPNGTTTTIHTGNAFAKVGPFILFTNASLAFILNLVTMALIKHTSALTLNVSGVFKDFILIMWSVIINGATVAPIQYVGYFIAATGVAGYSEYKRRLGLKPKPAVKPPGLVDEEATANELAEVADVGKSGKQTRKYGALDDD